MLHSLPILEVRAQPQGLVEGYASSFGRIDSHGDSVLPGAYAKTLGDHAAAGTMPAMLAFHNLSAPVGRWTQLTEDEHGLHCQGQVNLRTAGGQEAFEFLRGGDVSGLSIGFTLAPNGSKQRGDVRELNHIVLHEISLVSVPADTGARVTSVKSATAKPQTLRELQVAIQTLGFSRREAARICEKGFGGVGIETVPEDSELTEADAAAIATALRSLQYAMKGQK